MEQEQVRILIDLALLGFLSPIIIALVQIVKPIKQIPKVAYPVIAITLGIIGFITFGLDTVPLNILGGIVAGLTASGLYAGGKTVKNRVMKGEATNEEV